MIGSKARRALIIGGLMVSIPVGTARGADSTESIQPVGPTVSQIDIEVYEVVLQSWFGSSRSKIQVDEHLEVAPSLSNREVLECLQGVAFQARSGTQADDHSLRGATFKRAGIRVVDGTKWKAEDQQLESTVAKGQFRDADLRRAFAHALTSFSHIQFDQEGILALLTFSNVCGDLCGGGSTLLMKKSVDRWKVLKRCRGYVS